MRRCRWAVPDLSKQRRAFTLVMQSNCLAPEDNSTPEHSPDEHRRIPQDLNPQPRHSVRALIMTGVGGVAAHVRRNLVLPSSGPRRSSVTAFFYDTTTSERRDTGPGVLEHCTRYEHVLGGLEEELYSFLVSAVYGGGQRHAPAALLPRKEPPVRDFRLPPRLKLDLRSSGMLCSADWSLITGKSVTNHQSTLRNIP